MTDSALDDLLWRADTCPRTLTQEQLQAAVEACRERGWILPVSLRIELVTRLISGETDSDA